MYYICITYTYIYTYIYIYIHICIHIHIHIHIQIHANRYPAVSRTSWSFQSRVGPLGRQRLNQRLGLNLKEARAQMAWLNQSKWHGLCWFNDIMKMSWRYDMIWYDMTWYDMTWHDMIWYDMISWRYDMIWHDDIMTWWNVKTLCEKRKTRLAGTL